MGQARQAVCWCSLGALRKVLGYNEEDVFTEAARELTASAKKLYDFSGEGIATFNDDPTTTQEMVLAVFDDAIQRNTKETT